MAAHAQSSVTLYGTLDTGIVIEGGGPKGWGVNMSSGIQDVDRWGMIGSEDLGNGFKAIFRLEEGFSSNNGQMSVAGDAFNRGAYVGISSPYGTVKAGRDYTPTYLAMSDMSPFGNAFSGSIVTFNGEKSGSWASNQLSYNTPVLGGFDGLLSYSFGGVPGSLAGSQQMGFRLRYTTDGLRLQYAHYQFNNAAATNTSREDVVTARYDFGYVTAYLAFGADREPGVANFRDYHAGVSGHWNVANELYVAYDYKRDLDGHVMDTSGLIVNYTYTLSRQTNLYLAGMMLSNTRYSTTKFGSGSRELDIGIRHLF